MVERYRTRAMRLISEIEAGDNFRELIERELKDRLAVDRQRAGAEDAPALARKTRRPSRLIRSAAAPANVVAAPNACSGCGTTNDDDAQFCKKCGLKLA